jgi:succinate dehydrogenase/fumarate reductase-like Fe-S protein
MTIEIPEFYYCASCGVLVEGDANLLCRCRDPQPEQMHLEPFNAANVARVRDAIALGGRIRV